MAKLSFRRRMRVGEMIRLAWEPFMANLNTILIIIAVFYLPLHMLGLVFNLMFGTPEPGIVPGFAGASAGVAIALAFIRLLGTIAIMLAVHSHLKGKDITWTEALNRAFPRYWSALGTGVMAAVFIIGLLLLLIVPGIIFAVFWMFILYLVVLRDKVGRAALRASRALVQGRWWRTLGYALVIGLFSVAVMVIIAIPLSVMFFLAPQPILTFVIDVLAEAVAAYTGIVSLILFLNWEATNRAPA
ncbi:hypothetical protein JXB02_04810 [Candidatus Woesearchaeota archaeon]|nr:hypothetical protein [Candidatus Woesearchaeota archaeon]